jgi:hypothetical protein
MLGDSRKSWRYLLACIALAAGASLANAAGDKPTIDELKAKIAATAAKDRAHLCIQIAELQMNETARHLSASEDEQAKTTLADVVTYSELARDYAIQNHKHEKQAEIALREMTRKLVELSHTLGHDEVPAVSDAISHLQRARDDLLASMFKKGAK